VYLLVDPGFLPPLPKISMKYRGSFAHRMDDPDRHNGQRDEQRTNDRTNRRTDSLCVS